jgi:hypothetical protein
VGKVWVGLLSFGVGVFVGIQVAKAYAQNVIKDDITGTLKKVGLDGGVIETVADKLLVPQ